MVPPALTEFIEQARNVAADRMQRGVPAQGTGAYAADDLIKRQNVGVRAQLGSCFFERHVSDIGPDCHVRGDTINDVVHPLILLVVRVKHPSSVRPGDEADVQLRQIPVINKRPVILTVANHPNQTVAGILEHVRDNARRAAIHDSRTHDDRTERGPFLSQNERFDGRTPCHHRRWVKRSGFVCRVGRSAQNPGCRGVDEHTFRAAGSWLLGKFRESLNRKLIDSRALPFSIVGRMDVDVVCFSRVPVRCGIDQVAKNRPAATGGDLSSLLRRAHERRHVVTGAQQCVKYLRIRCNRSHRSGRFAWVYVSALNCGNWFRSSELHHNPVMARRNLLNFFDDLSLARGVFLSYDDGYRNRSYTYEDVARAARAFAGRLGDFGISQGDKVLVWGENRPEWVVAFWGCLLVGAIVVPIDYRASGEFVARVWKIVDGRLLLLGDDVSEEGTPDETLPDAARRWKLSGMDWHAAPSSVPRVGGDISLDSTAEIIFTSGATAEPKGVVITHRNVLANIEPVEREVLKYRKYGRPFFPLRFLNLLPLSHMFGQAMATFIPPMLAGEVIFIRSYNPHEIVSQIRRRRVSVLVSVPKILEVLGEHIRRGHPEARENLQRQHHWLRRWWHYRKIHREFGLKFWCFVVGAAPLESTLEEFWSALGFLVVQGYGLTETAPIVTLNHPFKTGRGSVGKAIGGVKVKNRT